MSPTRRNHRRGGMTRAARALAFGALALAALGCIHSRVLIESQPTGAEVIWRGQPYGPTPIEIPFVWYWHYDYRLEKPGYEPVEVVERFRTPPWFMMPFDLLMEIVPLPLTDTRHRAFTLQPRLSPSRNFALDDTPTTPLQTLSEF